MKRIRLLTVDYAPQKGGVARYLSELIRVYAQSIDVDYRPKTPRFLGALVWVVKVAHTSRLLIISHVYPLGFAAMIARYVTRTPYVLIFHGMDFDLARRSWWRRMILKWIIWSAKLIVTNSHALANEIAAFAKDEKPMVVYPPLSSELIESNPLIRHSSEGGNPALVDCHSMTACLRTDDEGVADKNTSIHLLTACRLVERKGVDRVLNLLPMLKNVHYTIAGDGEDKPRLEAIAHKLGIDHRVTFTGMLDDVELVKAYQSADVFVMPTTKSEADREGFGMVYIEAGYFGLPVVGFNHPGVSEAILDGETGYLVQNDEELVERLQQLVQNPDRRQQLGRRGHERSQQFTSERVFSKLERIIKRYA
ncbi:MAG: glycosyltransferase family 4 protein [bacterium]|nr:glycosyltransferase family 4 protein [bacterium]MDA1024369.1 glycosyltransferase family 4 protein [bacterium]